MNHTLTILVDNKPGVLQRVVGLISRRGFNIESLSVGPTENPTLSHITLVVVADQLAFEQIVKQLHKLVPVHKITDLTTSRAIVRELALFRINAPAERRNEIVEIANIFGANILDVGYDALTLELAAGEDRLRDLEDLLRAYGIKEIVRTGKIAQARNAKTAQ